MSEKAAWQLVLQEVRRQALRVAEAHGVQDPTEAHGRLYDRPAADDWQVLPPVETVREDGVWQQQQWLNAFEVLFQEADANRGAQHDDLLFFVLREPWLEDRVPLLVRRKGKALPADLQFGGQSCEKVDWCRSVLLNMVLQASYDLTVATCRRESVSALVSGRDSNGLPPDITLVRRQVYASPSRVAVNLDSDSKGVEEQPLSAYPDVCFAVDNFSDTFKSLVLAEPGWCYVVLLAATGGIALSPADMAKDRPMQDALAAEAPLQRASSQLSALASGDLADPAEAPMSTPAWLEQTLDRPTLDEVASSALNSPGPAAQPHEAASRKYEDSLENWAATKRELFSGFVSFEQLEDTLARDDLERRGVTKRPHWVRMRGPGGQGMADVAVTLLERQDDGHLLPSASELQAGAKAAALLGKALTAALQLASNFVGGRGGGVLEGFNIRCCLMNLALPVDLLACLILQLPLRPPDP